MDCSSAQPELSAYVDGELGRDQAEEVRRHLAECDACRATHAAFTAIDGALRELPVQVASPDFERRFRARIEQPRALDAAGGLARLRAWWTLPRMIPLGLVGAAAALALALWPPSPTPTIQDEDWDLLAEAVPFELVTSADYELMLALDALESLEPEDQS